MRSLPAALLVLLALAAALVVQTMGYAGRDLVEADRFADVTLETLGSEPGTELVGRTLTRALAADLRSRGVEPGTAVLAEVDSAVRDAVQRPAFAAALRPAVVRAHRDVLADPERGVRVDLASLRPGVVEAVTTTSPALAAAVPPASAFPEVTVPLRGGAEVAARGARELRDGWPAVALAGIAALLGALAVAGDRRAVLRWAGTGLLLLALVPVAVRVGAPEAARYGAPDGTGAVAAAFVRRLVDGWAPAAAWTAAAGLALLALGALVGRRR
ncbi:MAG TPA: hypothetical protein VNT51_00450 [Miltoncostaeaceae bacterium]|nr:hypothetical protein [Miltoncostaeaceae bacterium]